MYPLMPLNCMEMSSGYVFLLNNSLHSLLLQAHKRSAWYRMYSINRSSISHAKKLCVSMTSALMITGTFWALITAPWAWYEGWRPPGCYSQIAGVLPQSEFPDTVFN